MSLRPLLRSIARPVVPGRRPQPTLVRPYSQQPRNPYSRTGNDFKDDSHLPLFQRRVPQWSIVEKYIRWYFLGFAIPVTLLTAGYMEVRALPLPSPQVRALPYNSAQKI